MTNEECNSKSAALLETRTKGIVLHLMFDTSFFKECKGARVQHSVQRWDSGCAGGENRKSIESGNSV